MDTLETNDIQHFLLARTPAFAARYEFLTFRDPAAGRTWLSGLVDKVGTASSVGALSPDARWVTLAFTWNGLRALGLDEDSLSTFPDEFKQGMVERAPKSSASPVPITPITGWAISPVPICTPSPFSLRAMFQNANAAGRSTLATSIRSMEWTSSPPWISKQLHPSPTRTNISVIAIASLIHSSKESTPG